MKIIIFILVLLSLVLIAGCNLHSINWDKESCKIAGFEEPEEFSKNDIVRCKDGDIEVGVHYKELEMERKYGDRWNLKIEYKKRVYVWEKGPVCCKPCEEDNKFIKKCEERFEMCMEIVDDLEICNDEVKNPCMKIAQKYNFQKEE